MAKEKKKKEPLLITKSALDYDDLNSQQKQAVKAIKEWLHSKKRSTSEMIFRLGGVAGSGKSALVKYLLDDLKYTQEDCYVVAYTGQAVNVLRQNGILAKTIHSTFMHAKDVPLTDQFGNAIIKSGVPLMTTKFIPVKRIPSTVKLVVVDEASFLPEKLEKLILGYNVPILEMGDPVQLPPVSGTQCFHMDNLDFFLTEIMRQSKDSEIVRLATCIRNYDPIDKREYGHDVKFLWAQEDIEETFFRFNPFFKSADMIITTNNKDRNAITGLYREHILHAKTPYPMKGERLICRRNDWNLLLGPFPLTNGTQGTAVHTVGMSEVDKSSNTFILDFKPAFVDNDYYDGLLADAKFLRTEFGRKDDDYYMRLNPGKKFEYAHAITAHLAQGAQCDIAMFVDSFYKDPEYHMRIRYTAVTRAKKRLYYILPYFAKYPGWTDLWRGGFKPDEV